jgi:hypothetical protein
MTQHVIEASGGELPQGSFPPGVAGVWPIPHVQRGLLPPGSCFSSGRREGRHLMGFEEDRSLNLAMHVVCAIRQLRPDLTRLPAP